jgi:hypothetical protein
MKKHLIFSTIILNSSLIFSTGNIQTSAQEFSGCFMVDSNGQLVKLNHICTPAKEPEKPVIIKDIQLTETGLLFDDSNQPVVIGKLTNLSEDSSSINTITVQLEDQTTGDVVTALTINVKSLLKSNQSREFRERLDKTVDLGGRKAQELKIVFFDWD